MKEYLFYLLTVIGIGYFVSMSDLVKPIREWIARVNSTDKKYIMYRWLWDKLEGVSSCIYCASFWIGILVYFMMHKQLDITAMFNAFSVMGFIYLAKTISNR